jgi:hypothetical protein
VDCPKKAVEWLSEFVPWAEPITCERAAEMSELVFEGKICRAHEN